MYSKDVGLEPYADSAWLYSAARRAVGQARQLFAIGLLEDALDALLYAILLRHNARKYRKNPPRWAG